MSGQIFISYRREDSSAWARLVYDRLRSRFAADKIFMDVVDLAPGVDFVEALEESVGACDVLMAVIGRRWLTAADEAGQRRLEQPEDFVRIEAATALKRGIRVIPVLVDGATMPRSAELPEDLKALVRRHALEISHTRFSADSERLVTAVEEVLEREAAERRQRVEEERLQAEQRAKAERQELERRQQEEQARLRAEQQLRAEQEGLEAQRRQREEQERLKAEQRLRAEQERLEAERGASEAKERLEAEGRQKEEGKPTGKRKLPPMAKIMTLVGPVIGLVVCAAIYFGSQRPESKPTTPPVAVQPSAPPISGTPTKEEMARRALDNSTKEYPWVNSLGMKFVPVAGTQVFFSVWDTRVQDFEAFVADTDYDATGGNIIGGMWSLGRDGRKQRATWREPGFSQGPTHPVVGVSWDDAKKFCEWLTKREQGSGALPRGRVYRLPTDAEWSAGVGLQGEEGTNPKEKDGKIKLYPWGKEWPPPKGAGNYAGEESKIGEEPSDWTVIKGYSDGYPRTSPVGSFAANANGLYDMGGNVWEWCEDWYDATEAGRVLRGASWYDDYPDRLLASCRLYGIPHLRIDYRGFRCVVAAEFSR